MVVVPKEETFGQPSMEDILMNQSMAARSTCRLETEATGATSHVKLTLATPPVVPKVT